MRFLLAILFLLLAPLAQAQNMQRAVVVSACGLQALPQGPLTNLTMNPQGQLCLVGVGPPPPTYSGPGDVVASATAWYGLRAYNGAYAATPGKAVNLRRASDNASCDFNVASNGDFGVSATGCAQGVGLTPAAFATQDATASCTIATNTATCTGASSTPHVGSTVAGSGVGLPCYVTAVGTFTSGAGTVTLTGGLNTTVAAPCGTVGSATALTFTYGLYAATLYDQTGGNNCTGSVACDAVQATAAKQPQFLPSCLNAFPCLSYLLANTQNLVTTPSIASIAATFTMSVIAVRTAAFTTSGKLMGSASIAGTYSGYFSTANTTVMIQNATNILGTATDSAWHALQFVFTGAATSFQNIDGVSGTPASAGTQTFAANRLQIGAAGGATLLTGYMAEAGLWSLSMSSAQATSICHNQFAYWGTSVSC